MENNKINFEQVSFQIITYSGVAKSNAFNEIKEAKMGNIIQAKELITQAHQSIIEAEKQHMDIVQQEAQGVQHNFLVLFIHAEDQMLTSQMMIEIASEFIDLYEKIAK